MIQGVRFLGPRFRVCVVPAPAAAPTVVPAIVTAVAASASARGPFARAQLDAHALAAAVAPIEVANRVALQGRAGEGQVSGFGVDIAQNSWEAAERCGTYLARRPT